MIFQIFFLKLIMAFNTSWNQPELKPVRVVVQPKRARRTRRY